MTRNDLSCPIPAEDWPLADLQTERKTWRGRLNRFPQVRLAGSSSISRLIDLMVVAAVAQEPFVAGRAAGTAKSDLVLKFKDALGSVKTTTLSTCWTRSQNHRKIHAGQSILTNCAKARYIRRETGASCPTARLGFLDDL